MTAPPTARARVHAPGAELDVQPYDFEQPEVIGGALRERLDTALEAWGRQIGLHLTAKTRAVVDVAVAPFQVQSFAAFVASAEGATLTAAARFAGRRALYRVPVGEARYWAARMIGAAAIAVDAERPLTAVERALAARVVEEHLAELPAASDGLLPEPDLETLAEEAPADADGDELAVVAAVGLLRRGERRRLSLALPVGAVLDALGAVGASQTPQEVARRIAGHLALAPVEVALRFSETRVAPATVLSLAEGDLLPLAHTTHRPFVVTLDGSPVLQAAVGSNGGRLAFVVVEGNGDPT